MNGVVVAEHLQQHVDLQSRVLDLSDPLQGNTDDDDDYGCDGIVPPEEPYEFFQDENDAVVVSLVDVPRHDEGESDTTFGMVSDLVTNSIFYLLGIGLLVPWNAFVSSKPYFYQRLCRDIEVWFGLVYNISSVTSLACMILCNRFGGDTTISHNNSNNNNNTNDNTQQSAYWMVMTPLSIYLSVFVLTCVLVFIPVSGTLFLITTLLSLAICGAMGAIASAGLVATASSYNNNKDSAGASGVVGSLLAGQSVGGVIVSAANFIAAWLGGHDALEEYWNQTCLPDNVDPIEWSQRSVSRHDEEEACVPNQHSIDWAVIAYFGLSCLLLVACLVGFHYLYSSASRRYEPVAEVDDVISVTSSQPLRFVVDPAPIDELHVESSVWTKIRQPALTIFLNFVVTLTIFPAWTASLQSTEQCRSKHRLQNDLFTPLTFLWFNVFDLIGRWLAERYSGELSKDKLIPCALSRCIYFGIFALLPTSRRRRSRTSPFPSDFLSLVVQAAFAASNGFLLSWSFLVAPTCIEKQEQVKSSELLNFAMSFGLLAGSMLSFVYVQQAANL